MASDVVALVELGSNAVRLLVARLGPGMGFEVLEEERVQTRLGSGRHGALPTEGIARTVASAVDEPIEVEIRGAPKPGALPSRYVPSTERARVELGLEETVGFDEAVRRTLRWHRGS